LEIFRNNITIYLVSLGCSLFADPNIVDLLQGNHPEIWAGIGEGYWKSSFWRTKALISLKLGKIGPRLCYGGAIGNHVRAYDWCENQRPQMTSKRDSRLLITYMPQN